MGIPEDRQKPPSKPESNERQRHRKWRCVECGEEYGAAWVAYNGLRCHVECDHELMEVKNAS